MSSVSIADLLKLPVTERIRLVEVLWDSVAAVPEAVELSAAQREELDRRWEAYGKNPSSGIPWADVRARILRGE